MPEFLFFFSSVSSLVKISFYSESFKKQQEARIKSAKIFIRKIPMIIIGGGVGRLGILSDRDVS